MTVLDPTALQRLREVLIARGRPSIGPVPGTQPPPAGPLNQDQRAQVERVEPICELLCLMMSADGHCDPHEAELLRGAVRALTADSLRSAHIDAMLAEIEQRRAAVGMSARLEQVAAQLQADRADAEAAYSLAAAMALANGDVHGHEHALLDELGDLLGLSAKRRAELTQRSAP